MELKTNRKESFVGIDNFGKSKGLFKNDLETIFKKSLFLFGKNSVNKVSLHHKSRDRAVGSSSGS
jgi:hypothetical protein